MLSRCLTTCLLLVALTVQNRGSANELPQIDHFTSAMQRQGGLFPVYWDAAAGKVYLQVDRSGVDFLFLTALESGLGSNPVGLDRGQLGESMVCRWRSIGRRVFLEQQNTRFRAEGAPEVERRAVADSFAPSILWAGDVIAADAGSMLLDVTSLVVSDRHGISDALKSAGQGVYALDADRSFPSADQFKAFPNNTELPANLTFAANTPGGQVRSVAANSKAFTIRQRLSFIRLPDPDYQQRPFDPRIGSLKVAYADYAVPLEESIFKSWMVRHRLQLDETGAVVKPIVYYVDSAAPEPIRSALVEGASWWSEAFAAAGFPGGFRVEVAPAGMDPLDIRFHFIQWVHRQTRGWSYGSSVVDPRTGEIIKGHVSLGSLRVRQDRLITENLVAMAPSKPGAACGMAFPATILAAEQAVSRSQAIELSLARIRQLSAHEVGHTLGLAHNFAASTYGDRASVMDYPAPRFQVSEVGEIDASSAYAVGMGIWDMRTIDYMYKPFPDVAAWKAYSTQKLAEDIRDGIRYISDADARPLGGAHPTAHLWDNGSDPIAALDATLQVRELAIKQFSAQVLLAGEPQGELVRAWTPLYFHHRFQAEAVSKMVGGVDYSYSFPSDANAVATPVDADSQRRAVAGLMKTLEAETLAINDSILQLLIPTSNRTAWSNEEPSGFTDPVFDPLAAAATAASMTVDALLHPSRTARLASQATSVQGHPGMDLVLDPLTTLVEESMVENESSKQQAVSRQVATVVVNGMISLASRDDAREDVRAHVRKRLSILASQLSRHIDTSGAGHAELEWNLLKINRFLDRPDIDNQATPPLPPPPGSPIGSR